MNTVIQLRPICLCKEDAAAALAVSVSTFENLVAGGQIAPGRQISKGRVGWLVEELEQYARSRPVSSMLPPRNSGYGRAGKPAATADASNDSLSRPSQTRRSAS